MKERRSSERYRLALPCSVYSRSQGCWTDGLEARTRDISASGAYLTTEHPLPELAAVRVELAIPLPRSEHGGSTLISTGSVIRRDRSGMAVRFDKSQIFTLLRRQQN